MRKQIVRPLCLLALAIFSGAAAPLHAQTAGDVPAPTPLSSGWQFQDIAKVAQGGQELSRPGFHPSGWYPATVPGTVLTSYVNAGVYPEPTYGENIRRDVIIPQALCHTSYWYQTTVAVPATYAGRSVWLNFDGINYAAQAWVNGQIVGTIKGAFSRGIFDVTPFVKPGAEATVAVLIDAQPHVGDPSDRTMAHGGGGLGGEGSADGPTFLCTLGWDWLPAIPDRDTGIWQKVFLSASGPVRLEEPLVTSDLPLPRLDEAELTVQVMAHNVTDTVQKGVLKGNAAGVAFQQDVELPPHASKRIDFDSRLVAGLRLEHPRLWWPNGYGPQNMYTLHLDFETAGRNSDTLDVPFGIRKVVYSVPESENLTVSVNGVKVFCKGGNWGLDDALKRVPHERLEAQIRLHQLANLNLIRNWVGQSTSEDFYELCDRYGIMVWDEFFQPNPNNGSEVVNVPTYLANVREKIVRFRNHPSIVIWCGRNEGYPPKSIDDGIKGLMKELEPTRLYQSSSTDGRGVHSGGPYYWQRPQDYYHADEPFKTEIGSVSIPTLESIQGMMPQKDWNSINDDWALHDLLPGAQHGEEYPGIIQKRYGRIVNVADFARKGQMANYEAFRAMFEARESRLFNPSTAIITWMSHPAQPSFVWQLYHYDLEPNASLFAVRKACEMLHVQLNEDKGTIQIINHTANPLTGGRVHTTVYNLDGGKAYEHDEPVNAPASSATALPAVVWPENLSPVYFVKLQLFDARDQPLSDNFYWRRTSGRVNDLTALGSLPVVTLGAKAARHDERGRCLLTIELNNPSDQMALMAHLQLRRQSSGQRVLPVYCSDNYVSLVPHETRVLSVDAAVADLAGDKPVLVVDGWNVKVAPLHGPDVAVLLNDNAQVSTASTANWTMPSEPEKPGESYRINCGGDASGPFAKDAFYDGGNTESTQNEIDCRIPNAAPKDVYRTERWDAFAYTFPVKSPAAGASYVVRLHFAEVKYDKAGERKFSIKLNGNQVLTDFDIFAAAGGKNKAVVREFTGIKPDQNGDITIDLLNGSADRAKINGVEIFMSPNRL